MCVPAIGLCNTFNWTWYNEITLFSTAIPTCIINCVPFAAVYIHIGFQLSFSKKHMNNMRSGLVVKDNIKEQFPKTP